jgi:hypothetical protein
VHRFVAPLPLFVLMLALPGTSRGDDAAGPVLPESTPAEIVALVRQLGAASFDERERAAAGLVAFGPAALAAVEAAASAEAVDLETRSRARRVRSAIREQEHERRVAAFLAAEGPLADDVLPGWGRFRDEVGGDEEARRLFAEMQRAERELLAAAAGADEVDPAAKTLLERRCLELQNQYAYGGTKRLPLGSQAAIVFLAGDPSLELSTAVLGQVNAFCQYNDLRAELAGGPRRELARRLVGCWVAREDDANESYLYARVQLALQHDVPRGLVPARRLLDREISDYRLEYALFAVGRFGNEEDLPLVESLFSNTTSLRATRTKEGVGYSCQVRDDALAVAIELTGQRVEDYPFAQIRRNPQYLFFARTTGFANEFQRTAAFEKYAASRRSAADPN